MRLLVAPRRSVCFDSITLIGLARGLKDCVYVVSGNGQHFLKVRISTVFLGFFFTPPVHGTILSKVCLLLCGKEKKKWGRPFLLSEKLPGPWGERFSQFIFERSWMACRAPTSFPTQHLWDEQECQLQASAGFPKLHVTSCGRMRTNPSNCSLKTVGKSGSRRREPSLRHRSMHVINYMWRHNCLYASQQAKTKLCVVLFKEMYLFPEVVVRWIWK